MATGACFADRFHERAAQFSGLCVGLDPSPEVLSAWNLPDTPAGIDSYCDILIDALAERLAVMKPQAAYFERHGSSGFAAMERASQRIRETGCLSIIDAKRGDIGPTSDAYGKGFFHEKAWCDGLTVNAYLGLEALTPLLERATLCGTAVFVVARSSNPEGTVLQTAHLKSGLTVAEHIVDGARAFNDAAGAPVVGAVIGATLGHECEKLARRLGDGIVLAPGLGAQGATPEDVQANFGEARSRVIASASRSISAVGPNPDALRAAVNSLSKRLRSC